jgi:glycosyltransferase involved in cell wall biosynthesis
MRPAFDARKGVGQGGFMHGTDVDMPHSGQDFVFRDRVSAQSGGFRACVVIPSYNSGALLVPTVESVLRHVSIGTLIFVVIDGSTDGSEAGVYELANKIEFLKVLRVLRNEGKGAASLRALEIAHEMGCSHAAVFDSDGQHAAADLPAFFEAARRQPDTMILGQPVFGADAPWERVWGRKLANWCTNVETMWGGIGDSLFGFRVYPVDKALEVLRMTRAGRVFDFDTQMAVRLYWAGVRPVNLPTHVKYPPREEGGVTHFRYIRDNVVLAAAHTGLLWCAALRLLRIATLFFGVVCARRARGAEPAESAGFTAPGKRQQARHHRA